MQHLYCAIVALLYKTVLRYTNSFATNTCSMLTTKSMVRM